MALLVVIVWIREFNSYGLLNDRDTSGGRRKRRRTSENGKTIEPGKFFQKPISLVEHVV